jgi:hypothetical protein
MPNHSFKEGGERPFKPFRMLPDADRLDTSNLPNSSFNEERYQLQPATNPTQFLNLQEPDRNKTPERPQLGHEFSNKYPKQSPKEAARLARIGIGDVVKPQVNTREDTENLRYSELLRTFDATMQHWQADICTPEYLLFHNPKSENSRELTEWGFDREYPSKTSRIVTYPKRREYDALGNDMVRINAFSTIDYGHHLIFRASAYKNKAFIDPYNNEQLDRLTVMLTAKDIKAPYHAFIKDEDGEIIKDERGKFKTKFIENCSGSGILDTEEKQLEQVYYVQEEGPTP